MTLESVSHASRFASFVAFQVDQGTMHAVKYVWAETGN